MSLVNDMLRDLEARRAAPKEREQLDGLQAVDEAAAARRERNERLRRGSIWLASLVLLGIFVGLMLGRLLHDPLAPQRQPQPPRPPLEAAPAAKVLEVLPQHDGERFVLQLLLERSVAYRRVEESGAVSLQLPGLQLDAEGSRQGRVEHDGRSLSWRVEARGDGVQVLLVGLGERLQVRDRLEPLGERWQLWLEVPLGEEPPAAEVDLQRLPEAEPAPADEAPLPDWASRPAPPATPPAPAPMAAPTPVAPLAAPQVSIASHQPDALTQARQALLDEDYPRAIRELEALHQRRGGDPEVMRCLARAYLAGGQQQRLLAWLPGQLALHPRDAELRVLLARAQLQKADTRGAVATLSQHAPALASDPAYHALLAASYQQTGQWRESAALYRQLVALRPSQGAWQLGLGIALEQLGEAREAAQHYRLAQQGQGLDDGARRFAGERAQALGGQP